MRDLIQQDRNSKAFSFEDYFLTRDGVLDTDYYWDNYTDLQTAFNKDDETGLRNHWLTAGIQEGRRPSVVFDPAYYRSSYPDLATAGITTAQALLQHFLDFGFQEGRKGSAEFHAPSYLNRYSDIAALYGRNGHYKSFKHYVRFGQSLDHNAKP